MAGYIMAFSVMKKAQEKGYEKWTDLAVSMNKILDAARNVGRNKNVIFIFHAEKDDVGITKIKTAGKLLDNVVYIDGLFTYILNAEVIKDPVTNKVTYQFRTHTDGTTTCKTPAGCFAEDFIPNDMGLVIEAIEKFNNG